MRKNGTEIAREVVALLRPLFAIENRPGKLLPPSAWRFVRSIGCPCWPNCGKSCWFGKSTDPAASHGRCGELLLITGRS